MDIIMNHPTEDELRSRREEIETRVRAGLDEGLKLTKLDLRDLEKLGLLTPAEQVELDEIRRLDFLLGS